MLSKGSGDSMGVSSDRTGFKYWPTITNNMILSLVLMCPRCQLQPFISCPFQDASITGGLAFPVTTGCSLTKVHLLWLCPSLCPRWTLTWTWSPFFDLYLHTPPPHTLIPFSHQVFLSVPLYTQVLDPETWHHCNVNIECLKLLCLKSTSGIFANQSFSIWIYFLPSPLLLLCCPDNWNIPSLVFVLQGSSALCIPTPKLSPELLLHAHWCASDFDGPSNGVWLVPFNRRKGAEERFISLLLWRQKPVMSLFILSNFFFFLLLYLISLRFRWDCCHQSRRVVVRIKII